MDHSETTFEVVCVSGRWPDMDQPRDPELSLFFPRGSDCEQLNSGQGEGQVMIDGVEWGFYYNESGSLDVVLHGGGLSKEEAERVVRSVCEQLRRELGATFEHRLVEPQK
jgi:hypothetical protein